MRNPPPIAELTETPCGLASYGERLLVSLQGKEREATCLSSLCVCISSSREGCCENLATDR